jgi:hypothetical protein
VKSRSYQAPGVLCITAHGRSAGQDGGLGDLAGWVMKMAADDSVAALGRSMTVPGIQMTVPGIQIDGMPVGVRDDAPIPAQQGSTPARQGGWTQ